MSKRVKSLSESPCYKCGKMQDCSVKLAKNGKLQDIADMMFSNAKADYNWCPIYIALTAPDMIEVDDEQGDE